MSALINTQTFEARWTDMDQYCHVNHGRYFDYMTENRHEWLIRPFLNDKEALKIHYVLIDVRATFKKSFQYADKVTLNQYVESVGETSFSLRFEFLNNQGELYAEGAATLVCIDSDTHEKTPIPAAIRRHFPKELSKKHAEPLRIDLEKPLLNKITMPLRWTDIDAYQHVNNARYFDFFVETRAALLQQVSFLSDYYFFVIDVCAAFYTPIYYPGEVSIEQRMERVGKTSFTFSYRIFNKASSEPCCAESVATLVCVNKKTLRPTPVPPEIQKLGQ